jgi:hypothetical protein
MDKQHNKLIRRPRTHSTKDVYNYYKAQHPKAKEPYWLFKEVVARYNKKASDAVIMGQVFNFGSKLGHLLIRKIRRNYEKPVVDWGESKRYRNELLLAGKIPKGPDTPEGENWLSYFSDPWYLRWGWVKKKLCRVKNQTVYKFVPTGNRSKKAGNTSLKVLGNKGKLTLMNKINPMLHVVYDSKMYSIKDRE